MPRVARVILSTFTGLVGGAAIVLLAIIACVMVAFASKTDVRLPGLFTAWFSEENGLPALNFTTNGLGMLAVIVAVTLVSVSSTVIRSPRREQTPHQ